MQYALKSMPGETYANSSCETCKYRRGVGTQCKHALIWPTMPGAENTSFSECLYAVVAGATTSLALFRTIGLCNQCPRFSDLAQRRRCGPLSRHQCMIRATLPDVLPNGFRFQVLPEFVLGKTRSGNHKTFYDLPVHVLHHCLQHLLSSQGSVCSDVCKKDTARRAVSCSHACEATMGTASFSSTFS